MELFLIHSCSTPMVIFFPLHPTSVSSAASLSHCFLALPWAPQRTWLCPLSSQTMGWRTAIIFALCLLCMPNSAKIPLRWVCDTNCPNGSLSTLGTLSSPLVLVCTKSSQGLRSWETHSFSWLHGYLGTKMFLSDTFTVIWSVTQQRDLWRLGCWILHLSPLHHFP